MVRQKRYRGRRAGHGPVMVNVRMRWRGRGRQTAGAARAALRATLRSGTVPRGWQLAAVEWGRPGHGEGLGEARERLAGTDGWVEGDISDLLEKFAPLFEHLRHQLVVGVVK